ncbi:hypothetical protein ACMD2_10273 [Ananas comosus]|uniref:Uncharacterized protein n=1 Tax=Ananas comosus TaxID=4615 RepID=A0A199V2I2_ANACO|nr:hypothetical protein ACMD2_10273 [Ananas comosus]
MEKSRSFPSAAQYHSYSYIEGRTAANSSSYSFNGPSGTQDGFASSADPELKRKRRIAAYNVFAVEGRLKSSVRSGFKWIKSKLSDARYGI